MDATVVIHGDEWKRADIDAALESCRSRTWVRQVWRRSPALVHRRGSRVSQYRGQAFDPAKIDLVPDGWTHDHCAICYWTLGESEDPDVGVGYTDGDGDWVCLECHSQFLGVAQ